MNSFKKNFSLIVFALCLKSFSPVWSLNNTNNAYDEKNKVFVKLLQDDEQKNSTKNDPPVRPWFKSPWFQVPVAVVLGVGIGYSLSWLQDYMSPPNLNFNPALTEDQLKEKIADMCISESQKFAEVVGSYFRNETSREVFVKRVDTLFGQSGDSDRLLSGFWSNVKSTETQAL